MRPNLKIVIAVTAAVMALVAAVILAVVLTNAKSVKTEAQRNPRIYYLAAEEVLWDYAPRETDLLKERREDASKSLDESEDPMRLGKRYKKAVFREYTDSSYSEKKRRPAWLGILGPLIETEVGDIVKINVYNNASHPVSLHTHGAQYVKHHEGAFYQDNTPDKRDDKVFPGQNYTYTWSISENRGPTESDTPCMLWAYHSHVSGDEDIHTGLLGPLLICKQGYLDEMHQHPESSSYFVLLFLIFDENQSWYLDENIAEKQTNATQINNEEIKENEQFKESNLMYSVNGLMYDNLKGLETCYGSQVTWYLMGMGNEADIHAITFPGHPILVRGHRTDVVHLFPAKFESALMTAGHEGSWPITSEVDDASIVGMEARFLVRHCENSNISEVESSTGRIREFFITAEEIVWNYAPSGTNQMNRIPLLNDSEAAPFFERGENRIGGTYKKVVYRGYTDQHFTEPLPHPPHQGLLGPTIRAEVGETVQVHFFNKATKAYAFQLTAFMCSDCEMAGQTESSVAPMGNRTYSFFISEDLGPSSKDPQCISWRYFSAVEHLRDIYGGLNGVLLTCRPRTLKADGKQRNVDKEFTLMFAVMDENKSPYIDDNIANYTTRPDTVDKEDEDFVESNLMHSINGLMYGHLSGLEMCLHDRVSWILFAIGDVVDMHVVYFNGNTILRDGVYRDTVDLMASSHQIVSMTPDSLGTWGMTCRTNDHLRGGMKTKYKVKSCNNSDDVLSEDSQVLTADSKIREYYVAAVDEEWDYAPFDYHIVTGERLTENEDSRIFVTRDATHVGSKYKKTLYREFTDSTFSQRKTRTPEEEHLGLLGPVIKAEVGETIRVVFQNKASREFNINPHGLPLNSSQLRGVKPGRTEIYTWKVPPRSGPTSGTFNCSSWMYYSAVDAIKDLNTGLVGPLIICNPGILTNSGSRTDVDKEFSVLFTVFDENESWYLEENVNNYCLEPEKVDIEDDDFKESNLKHSLNGLLYGALHGLGGTVGDTVAWYLMGLGNEIDIHTAHFHGMTFLEKDDPLAGPKGHKADVTDLFPGIFRAVQMTFDTPGTWLFHCHVDDHLKGGMIALVTVTDRNATTLSYYH